MKSPMHNLAAALVSVALLGVGLGCDRANQPTAPSGSKAASTSPSFDRSSASEQKFRWDIVSINFAAVPRPTVSAGGIASARANDNSKITLTGTGTFGPNGDNDVTGGGTWKTFTSGGTQTGSGTYRVTGLVRFDLPPGAFPPFTDLIGNPADGRGGLVFLRIAYNDGSRGVLVVSCHFVGTPDAVFEGITASKGFVDVWNREAPAPGVDANRTAFHVLIEEDD